MDTPIGTKFCHLGDKYTNINGKITIASLLTPQGVKYGVAFCSPKDRFKKSLGRTIAVNRMVDLGMDINLTQEEINHKQIMVAILDDILTSHEYPNWAEEVVLDHIDWYNIDDTTIDAADLNEIDNIMTWLNNMPKADSGLLKVMISQYVDEVLS